MPITLIPYTPAHGPEWDAFVATSKNGTFLFMRGYMEYHADRFTDASLLAYEDGHLVALLPANRKSTPDGDILQSHGGLTYGGFITDSHMTAACMLDLFAALRAHLHLGGYTRCLYKVMPSFYHQLPAEEDLYALFRNGAKLTRVDVSTTIPLTTPLPLSSRRKRAHNTALKAGLVVRESSDYPTFFTLLAEVLKERHDTTPTHTAEEIEQLTGRFPHNIRLFAAFNPANEMLGGTIIYDCGPVIHTQYLLATAAGRDLGALDLTLITLFQQTFADRKFFDFGISTNGGGTVLNTGLIAQKEMFGGRSTVHQFYELTA